MRAPSDEWLNDWDSAADRGCADRGRRGDHRRGPAAVASAPAACGGTAGPAGGPAAAARPASASSSAPVPGAASPRPSRPRSSVTAWRCAALPRVSPCRPSAHTITPVEKPLASKIFAIFVPRGLRGADRLPGRRGGVRLGARPQGRRRRRARRRDRDCSPCSAPRSPATATTSWRPSAEHIVDGLVFAFKAMGVVLPIAGFFFLGNGDFSGQIMSLGDGRQGPGVPVRPRRRRRRRHLPTSGFITAFGILIVGMIAGLEGSGFSGLPLTGSLAGSLGPRRGRQQPDAGGHRPDGQHLVRRRHAGRLVLAARGGRLRPGAGGRAGAAVLPAGRGRAGGRDDLRRWSSSASSRPARRAAPDRTRGPGLLHVRGSDGRAGGARARC